MSCRRHRKLNHHFFFLMHLPVVCKTGMMPTLLLCIRCRWCNLSFHVCRSCWRGQAYCCDRCRDAGRRYNHRNAQRRYRQSARGKKAHCQAENRRRHGWSAKSIKNMDDATSTARPLRRINRFMREKSSILGSHPQARCHFCGSLGQVVDRFPRRGYG